MKKTVKKTSKKKIRSLADHPMYTHADFAYFCEKGFSNEEIFAVWDRDLAAGREPCRYIIDPVTIMVAHAAVMVNGLRENLSPEAISSIAAHIQGARTNNLKVDQEVVWFCKKLIGLVGGHEQQARLMEELGL